jgi:hypothetical protein
MLVLFVRAPGRWPPGSLLGDVSAVVAGRTLASVQGPTSLGSAARKGCAVAAQACVNAATTAPNQQMQGMACAKRRSRRSRSTVGAVVMCSRRALALSLLAFGAGGLVLGRSLPSRTHWTEATGRAALRQGDIQPRVGGQPSRDSSVRLHGPTQSSPPSWPSSSSGRGVRM